MSVNFLFKKAMKDVIALLLRRYKAAVPIIKIIFTVLHVVSVIFNTGLNFRSLLSNLNQTGLTG